MIEVGKGIKYNLDESGLLSIEIDTTQDFGRSTSGKSTTRQPRTETRVLGTHNYTHTTSYTHTFS